MRPTDEDYLQLAPLNGYLFYSALNGNLEVPVYFLKAKQGYTARKWKKINGHNTVYTDKFRHEVQEQKEVPVRYVSPFRALLLHEDRDRVSIRTVAYSTIFNFRIKIKYQAMDNVHTKYSTNSVPCLNGSCRQRTPAWFLQNVFT
jgi:transposase-like protein